MARPSLGERDYHPLRYPRALDLADMADRAGYRTVNRYVSDLLCAEAGQAHLMLGPDKKEDSQPALWSALSA